MKTLQFAITINAPVSMVRDTMLNHPTYEQWTAVFSEGSTYEGSWDQGSDIMFGDPSGQGMIANIAENRLHEYISIHHLGEIMLNEKTNQLETTMYDGAGYENYTLTPLGDHQTQLDVEFTSVPEDYADMFADMRPKSLQALKDLCE